MPQTEVKDLYYPVKVDKTGVLVVAHTKGCLDAAEEGHKPDPTIFWPQAAPAGSGEVPLGNRKTTIKDALLLAQKQTRKEVSKLQRELDEAKGFLGAVDEGLAHPEKLKIVNRRV